MNEPAWVPVSDLMLDDLAPEEYLLLLDWCLVNVRPFDQPSLAYYVQYSPTWQSELLLWRQVQRAVENAGQPWWRRVWRWCWRYA